jgi:dienelactone hydrolase
VRGSRQVGKKRRRAKQKATSDDNSTHENRKRFGDHRIHSRDFHDSELTMTVTKGIGPLPRTTVRLTTSAPPPIPPDRPGPFKVQVQKGFVKSGDRSIPTLSYVPQRSGRSPLVVFLPGFGIGAGNYEATLRHLASHGFMVVAAEPPKGKGINHAELARDASKVIEWASQDSRVDPIKTAIMGHSMGGKVAVMTAAKDPRVGPVFVIDPVFQSPPFQPQDNVLSEQVAGLKNPIAVISETVDKNSRLVPEGQGPKDFYAKAVNAPRSIYEFIGANHTDFASGLHPILSGNSPAKKENVIGGLNTLMTAFMLLHLNGQKMDAYLDPIRVSSPRAPIVGSRMDPKPTKAGGGSRP